MRHEVSSLSTNATAPSSGEAATNGAIAGVRLFDERRNPPPRGFVDRFIRRFRFAAQLMAILCLYAVGALAGGIALAPALYFLYWALPASRTLPGAFSWIGQGASLGAALFIAGFALLVVVPVFNKLLPTRVKPFKGGYYTIAALPWYLHNGLFYLVRFTFLPFVTLTPFGIWFLRAMGMKIGRNAYVNTEYISDPMLLTLGDHAALGGSVRIFAHYGGGGNLVIAPVVVGPGATVGLGATVMGDVEIGAGAVILPHSVLLPGSRVGPGETWGGVPARPISRADLDALKAEIRGGTPRGTA
jgi:acetyltransferase-like isoleucine patch superfamily enzyme